MSDQTTRGRSTVTIRDVARVAGVAVSTVSATLNGSGRISEATRARVREAVEAVGYRPNAIARSLRLGRSSLLGLVVGNITNPYWSTMVQTLEREADRAGYSIVICSEADDPAREGPILEQLRRQNVAGILISSIDRSPGHRERLERADLPPVVTVDHRVPRLQRDFVGVDNRKAVHMLVDHLAGLGHRRIAMIGGQPGLSTSDERHAAFGDAMKRHGLALDPAWSPRAAYTGEGARAAAHALLDARTAPTAIIGANNLIALGVLEAIFDRGLDCPRDLSLVGIDDVPWSGLVRPRITTAAQPIETIGTIAMAWLLGRIHTGDGVPRARTRLIAPIFIEGESCAPPASN
ncbi:LacI family DNA-binding transcriptional regulator [Marinivivus vitaminiproducens]|uniref:LacI family DNA-binding transcriptional regulator n=1 Tax=Marinivivus vitaminiproducens TaxID=3035935 RepID=UPI00279A7368|nr:LacI family DNA-binding transcriptional regulator [Geminicoccaceae bacterium SCSIO 64248]